MINVADLTKPEFQDPLVEPPREDNKLRIEDRAAHDWYRFVLSFPAHLVRTYIDRFALNAKHTVLDPFCGTGTTFGGVQKGWDSKNAKKP